MSHRILILSSDSEIIDALSTSVSPEQKVDACGSLDELRAQIEENHISAVFVHFGSTMLNGHTPGQFVAELSDLSMSAPLFGIFDSDCPARLRVLGSKAVDDYLVTPLAAEQISSILSGKRDLENALEKMWEEVPHKELQGRTRTLVTFTPDMFEMLDEIKVAARHRVTSLLIGETGCGKTFLARLIHELSEQRDAPFCTVACGALPPDLIESELFGYVKGAFTGADRDREGKFAAAGNGTLLLDEIDVLPPEQQAKLLRVIETGEYEPVGSNDTQKSQARLIVASNYNLEDLVHAGTFRTDLYYRLNVLSFRLPPLRERPWDIRFLAYRFALQHARDHGVPLRGIEPQFLEALQNYDWPGNVREMENVLRRAVLYCQRGVLTLGDLPSSIRTAQEAPEPQFGSNMPANPIIAGKPVLPVPNFSRHDRRMTVPADSGRHGHAASVSSATPSSTRTEVPKQDETAWNSGSASLEERVDRLECKIIQDSLQRNNHRRKETAAELGISRVTLYNKMKKFGLL